MNEFKELRIVLPIEKHNAFKARAKLDRMSLKAVIEMLIDDYNSDRWCRVVKEDMEAFDRLVTRYQKLQTKQQGA